MDKESVITLVPTEDEKTKGSLDFLFDTAFDSMDEIEKMYQNRFYDEENDKEYTVEGSIPGCSYGYNLTKIGIMEDHAVYDVNGNALLTCGDCVAGQNIYNFGLCGSPSLGRDSEKAVIDRVGPYAVTQKIVGYKCRLQLLPEWQTAKGHTHISNARKNKNEYVLPQDGQ